MQMMEEFWLAKAAFVAGDEICLADLQYACEIQQLSLLDGAEQVTQMRYMCCCLMCYLQYYARK